LEGFFSLHKTIKSLYQVNKILIIIITKKCFLISVFLAEQCGLVSLTLTSYIPNKTENGKSKLFQIGKYMCDKPKYRLCVVACIHSFFSSLFSLFYTKLCQIFLLWFHSSFCFKTVDFHEAYKERKNFMSDYNSVAILFSV